MTMIMIMIMESYDHHEPPTAVRGSIGGCSMDMWCPYSIGRGSWDWEGLDGIGLTPSPERGDVPSGCVSLELEQASVTTGELLLLLLLNMLVS